MRIWVGIGIVVMLGFMLIGGLLWWSMHQQQSSLQNQVEQLDERSESDSAQQPAHAVASQSASSSIDNTIIVDDPQHFEILPDDALDYLFSSDDMPQQQAAAAQAPASVAHPQIPEHTFQEHPELEGDELARHVGPLDAKGRYRVARIVDSSFKYPRVRHEEWWQHGQDKSILIRRVSMVADHVMVTLQPGQVQQDLEKQIAAFKGQIRRHIPGTQTYLVSFDGIELDQMRRAIETLHGAGGLSKIVEPDYIVYAITDPDDPSFNQLYGLHNTGQTGGTADADIDAPEAWDINTGSHDVLVGVIDTGIDYTHPDLIANMWVNDVELNGVLGVDDDNNGYVDDIYGYDFSSNDGDPMDGHSHGTHVAGTIGANGNNGTGVVGVCWQVSMAGIKFLSDAGSGTTSDAIESVNYATTIGCHITNNSWGGGGFSQQLSDAIYDAADADAEQNEILFVAAAGNTRSDNDVSPHYPSSYAVPNIIAVASTDHNDLLSSFSCYGATSVDLAAPGSAIYSTIPGNGYASKSGTSMASPHVAGACALLRASNRVYSATQLKEALLNSVDQLSVLNGKMVSNGRLNLHEYMVRNAGPQMKVTSIELLEDGTQGSQGNGDRIFNPGEVVAVPLTLSNIGGELAADVELAVSLVETNPHVSFLGNTEFRLGDIEPGTDVVQNPLLIQLDPAHAAPQLVKFNITIASSSVSDTWNVPFTIIVANSSQMTGVVKTIAGGVPIAGATINFDGPMKFDLISDVNGEFVFDVMDGVYTVSSTPSGYVETSVEMVAPLAAPIEILIGRPKIELTPSSFELTVGTTPVEETLLINNNGDKPLQVDLRYLANRLGIEGSVAAVSTAIESSDDSKQWSASEPLVSTEVVPLNGVTGVRDLNCLYLTTILTDGGSDEFTEAVQALPQVGVLTVYNGRFKTPSLPELESYDVVLVSSNTSWHSPIDYGDVLADYIDGGGSVVLLVASFANSGSYGLSGRLMTSAYLPIVRGGPGALASATQFEVHPITEGVRQVTSTAPVSTTDVEAGCISLGTFSNGYVIGAVHGDQSVVALNVFPLDGRWSGDWPLLVANSLEFLGDLSPEITMPSSKLVIDPGEAYYLNFTVTGASAAAGNYKMGISLDHNDPIADNPLLVPIDVEVLSYTHLASNVPSVDFGVAVLNQPLQRQIILKNTGNNDITISSASIDLLDCIHDLVTPSVLPSNEELVVTLTLNSQNIGVYAGQFIISSDADNVSDLVIDLKSDCRVIGLPDSFIWDTIADQEINQEFSVHLSMVDAYGTVIPDYNGSPTLSIHNAQADIQITECGCGLYEFVEIQNVSASTVDTIGLFVAVSASAYNINQANSTVWSLGDMLASGECAYRTDYTYDNYWGSRFYWSNDRPGWAIISDKNGKVLDAVFWGWSDYDISRFAPMVNGVTLELGDAWTSVSVKSKPLGSLQRIGNRDQNAALNWDWRPESKGIANEAIVVPFVGSSAVVSPTQVGPFLNGEWSGNIAIHDYDIGIQVNANDAGINGFSNRFDITNNFLSTDVAEIDFGDVVINQQVSQNVVLSNVGNHLTEISNLTSTLSGSSLSVSAPTYVPAENTLTITVSFTGNEVGVFAGELRIVSNAEDHPDVVIPLSVNVDPFATVAEFRWDRISDPAYNSAFDVGLTAFDIYGNVVKDYTGIADLSVLRPVDPTLVITECDPDSVAGIEIQNVSPHSINVDEYFVAIGDNTWSINYANQVTWRLSGEMASGEIQYRTESPTDNYWGRWINWSHNSSGWAAIVHRDGRVVDAIIWGFSYDDIEDFAPTANGVVLDLGEHYNWYPRFSTGSLQRYGHDWEAWSVNLPNVGHINEELTIPWHSTTSDLAITPNRTGNFTEGSWSGSVHVDGFGRRVRLLAKNETASGTSNLFNIHHRCLRVDTPVDIPGSEVGRPIEGVIRLINNGTTAVSINEQITLSNDVFELLTYTPARIYAGQQFDMQVRFTPDALGPHVGVLHIDSNAQDNPMIDMDVVAYGLTAPSLHVTPDRLELNVATGSIASFPFEIQNRGGAPLTYKINASTNGLTALASGGPDDYGYLWRDSDDEFGPAYVWQDISETGQLLSISSVDDGTTSVSLPFNFIFYGQTYSSVRASSNGFLSFVSSATSGYNYRLPSKSAPPALIAGWHDDLDPGRNGNVYYQAFTDHVVFQYDKVKAYGLSTSFVTFQIVLHKSGKINCYYKDMNLLISTSATIGIQDHSRDDGLTVVYNGAYIKSELAVEFVHKSLWLDALPRSGIVDGGGVADIEARIYATALAPGSYEGNLEISSNDPDTPTVNVPVYLNVTGLALTEATVWGRYSGGEGVLITVDGDPASQSNPDWWAAKHLGWDGLQRIDVHAEDPGRVGPDSSVDHSIRIEKTILPLSRN